MASFGAQFFNFFSPRKKTLSAEESFLELVRAHPDVWRDLFVGADKIICCPVSSSLGNEYISKECLMAHILVPVNNSSGEFINHLGQHVHIYGNYIICGFGFKESRKVKLLNVSTLSNGGGTTKSITVFSVARPLVGGIAAPEEADEISLPFMFKYLAVLRSFPEVEATFAGLDEYIKEVNKLGALTANEGFYSITPSLSESLKDRWHRTCERIVRTGALTSNLDVGAQDGNMTAKMQIPRIVESYLMYGVSESVYPWICSLHQTENANMLFVVSKYRHCSQFDLGVRPEFQAPQFEAVRELCQLSTALTPVDKMIILKKTVNSIREAVDRNVHTKYPESDVEFATDDLLLLIIWVIIQSFPFYKRLAIDLQFINVFHFSTSSRSVLGFNVCHFEVAVSWFLDRYNGLGGVSATGSTAVGLSAVPIAVASTATGRTATTANPSGCDDRGTNRISDGSSVAAAEVVGDDAVSLLWRNNAADNKAWLAASLLLEQQASQNTDAANSCSSSSLLEFEDYSCSSLVEAQASAPPPDSKSSSVHARNRQWPLTDGSSSDTHTKAILLFGPHSSGGDNGEYDDGDDGDGDGGEYSKDGASVKITSVESDRQIVDIAQLAGGWEGRHWGAVTVSSNVENKRSKQQQQQQKQQPQKQKEDEESFRSHYKKEVYTWGESGASSAAALGHGLAVELDLSVLDLTSRPRAVHGMVAPIHSTANNIQPSHHSGGSEGSSSGEEMLCDIQQLACGASHMVALDVSGNVFVWGDNRVGQLGLSPATFSLTAPRTALNQSAAVVTSRITGTGAGATAASSLSSAATSSSWSSSSSSPSSYNRGRRGSADGMNHSSGEYVAGSSNEQPPSSAYARSSGILGRDIVGESSISGFAGGELSVVHASAPVIQQPLHILVRQQRALLHIPLRHVVSSVACGAYHTLCLTADGAVYSWGRAANGRLGQFSDKNHLPEHMVCQPGLVRSSWECLPPLDNAATAAAAATHANTTGTGNNSYPGGGDSAGLDDGGWDVARASDGGPNIPASTGIPISAIAAAKLAAVPAAVSGITPPPAQLSGARRNSSANSLPMINSDETLHPHQRRGSGTGTGTGTGAGPITVASAAAAVMYSHANGSGASLSSIGKHSDGGDSNASADLLRNSTAAAARERTNSNASFMSTPGLGDSGEAAKQVSSRSSHVMSSRVVYICAGHHFSVAVTACGSVFTWGCGSYGALGHGQHCDEYLPRQVLALRFEQCTVKSAAAGSNHTVFLTDSGRLFGCGLNNKQQVGSKPVLYGDSMRGISTSSLGQNKLDRISVLVPRPIVASATVISSTSTLSSSSTHYNSIKRASKNNLSDLHEFAKFKSVTCGKNFTAAIAINTTQSGSPSLSEEYLLAWGAVSDVVQSANKRLKYLSSTSRNTTTTSSTTTTKTSELKLLDIHCDAVNISPALLQVRSDDKESDSGQASPRIYQIIGAGATLGVLL